MTLSSKIWTDEVFVMCRLVDHIPAPISEYDGGRPGKFNACQAEKQLMAYFVNNHVFLGDEVLSEDEIEKRRRQYEDDSVPQFTTGRNHRRAIQHVYIQEHGAKFHRFLSQRHV